MSTLTRFATHSPPMEDAQLVSQARTQPEAFAELYRRHITRVYRYHLAHTGNCHDAEDLTSQTFLAALESLHSYRGSGSFSAWLMGIAMRKRLMLFRSGTSRDLPIDDALDIPDPASRTDQAAFDRMRISDVLAAMTSLNAERREAIALCFFAGLNYDEAARVLRKTPAAVKMLVSRGLADLRSRTSVALEVEND